VALGKQVEVERVRGRTVDADDRDVARLLDVDVPRQRYAVVFERAFLPCD
jgi:hypothetical protein